MLFTWALIMTQPEMSKRITMLAGDLGDAARRRRDLDDSNLMYELRMGLREK
jgi:hypothetical protein